ncbi:MAG: hypothetical protein WC881_08140, partial [Elusimicrobiota bacterium]
AYYDNSGGLLVDFSVSGATTGAIGGQVFYTGSGTGALDVVANLKNWDALTPQATATLTLAGGATAYPYVIGNLNPGRYVVTAQVRSNPVQSGRSTEKDGIEVVVGSTVTTAVAVALSSCAAFGSVAYGGTLTQGVYRVFAATSPDMENALFVGAATMTSAGAFTMNDLPIPNTFYFLGFLDGNYNNEPDGPEPLGYYGSTDPRRGISDFNLGMTGVYASVNGIVITGVNMTFVDNGAVTGNVSLPGGAQGQVIISGIRGTALENRQSVRIYGAGMQTLWYSLGLLRPATDYSIFAFLDRNSNGNLDAGEEAFTSPANIAVPSGGQATYNFNLLSASSPSAVAGFSGVGQAGQVYFQWSPAAGAAQYRLSSSTAGVLAVSSNTYYFDVLSDNTSSQIRAVAAVNINGVGSSTTLAAVYSLAAAPALSTAAVYMTSVTLAVSAANPDGTQYLFYRSTDPAKNGAAFLQSSAASVSDQGLAPATTYYWRALAVNGNGIYSGFGSQASTRTPATAG